ncbi:MAG: hypothetical protein KDJ12_04960, partial [Hyphomicrobiales bacterium]|nr:hypothetical protein [Hyphomicrobiales bacterium]
MEPAVATLLEDLDPEILVRPLLDRRGERFQIFIGQGAAFGPQREDRRADRQKAERCGNDRFY